MRPPRRTPLTPGGRRDSESMTMSRKLAIGLCAALVVIVAIGGALFRYALPGLSSARPEPPAIEIAVASWLLVHSVPPKQANRVHPLQPNEAGLAAGESLFQR